MEHQQARSSAKCNDSNGATLLGSVSASNSVYTSGGFGFKETGNANTYWDTVQRTPNVNHFAVPAATGSNLHPAITGSSSVIRIATYNMAADINGATTPLAGFYADVEGMGEEEVEGNARPVDILALQETTSNSTTVAPVVTNLNSYYNGAAVYAQSPYQATQSGSNSSGNGPNAMVYDTSTLNLLASVGVGTPGGFEQRRIPPGRAV